MVSSGALLSACSGHTVRKAELVPSFRLHSRGTERTTNIVSSKDDEIKLGKRTEGDDRNCHVSYCSQGRLLSGGDFASSKGAERVRI